MEKDFCDNEELKNQYIIAGYNSCFGTCGFHVFRIKDYYAIGAGEDFARGAMFMGASPEEAVKACLDLCISVSEPVVIETLYFDQ